MSPLLLAARPDPVQSTSHRRRPHVGMGRMGGAAVLTGAGLPAARRGQMGPSAMAIRPMAGTAGREKTEGAGHQSRQHRQAGDAGPTAYGTRHGSAARPAEREMGAL
ncbi:hypothetical protein [Streptomyces sp. CAU 1734]|uniref:hypothetical protein n=1 Tax=Streptomyces sp. CAU 1734 TaxID=3140360 RepID=UPI003261029B